MPLDPHSLDQRPEPWERYTAELLWADPWVSSQMLAFHLDPSHDISSRSGAFITRATQWMTERFYLGPGRAVGDFGCGPGLYASRLAATGAEVTGIDFSPRSIAYARGQAEALGLSIDYRCMNYLDFAGPERFDLILLIYGDYCALSPEQRGRLLGVFARSLKPGGALLMDLFSTHRFAGLSEAASEEEFPQGGFWAQGPHRVLSRSFLYPEHSLALDRYHIVEQQGEREVYNWLQHFEPQGLGAELAAHGWAVEQALGSVAGDSYEPDSDEFAVIARLV
ncbi:MAG: methyltransferase domain-containing protein [Desulfarculaceae bacterium]|nr:methyltransferase domain-containing protein [Desulfarculaceae bacterium]